MEAERRQVTILFTDMVGFTTFSERSGEEAAFTLMRSLSKLMGDAVREQGGVVQGFTGDGIMAVFGAPTAFEDGPLRACRSALAILERLRTAGGDLEAKHGVRPQMRIGLNTGPAVVGQVEGGDAAVTVLGDTVNFAARLQSLAEPGSVCMSDATHKLVQGLVDATFAGEHAIKGKSEPQKTYRLDAIRHGATRFEAAISRGLSAFEGRKRELEAMDRALIEAGSQLQVVDLVAEPGMGKSRLLHEFRRRIGKERAFVLSGSCSPDGQQTAFLPFIEVVRGSFRINAGEAEKDIAQKLETGLTSLGLHSQRNLGLLLHLLGLKAPEGVLTGLDGLLIGLLTRELFQQLLEARCRLSLVVMVIEDLHWIDSVSVELLGRIIDIASRLRLLILTTRRPEYAPPWLDRTTVTEVQVEPLQADQIRRLVQGRLGVETLPEALARQVTEKAEGNPLFAEEIVSFLTERDMLRLAAGKLEFDANQVAAALPGTVQNLLTARGDRLAAKDRALLQAASVIGRRFDPELLAVVVGETALDARLAAMLALDLVRREGKSSDYEFKHALVRDSLYQSLLTDAREALHLKVAEEIERRSGNRLVEVAETLAYHYRQTERPDKAFTYLAMAGEKCLSVYSLDETENHLSAAVTILDKNSECATDQQVADFLVTYTMFLWSMSADFKKSLQIIDRYLPRLERLGDDMQTLQILHQKVMCLFYSARFREAAAVQKLIAPMAERLGDDKSRAYSLAGAIHISTALGGFSVEQVEALGRDAVASAARTGDRYIQTWIGWIVAWDQLSRGRVNQARKLADEIALAGVRTNDPRPATFALWVRGWIALASDDYSSALSHGEHCAKLALTPLDQIMGLSIEGVALVLLRNIEKGEPIVSEVVKQCAARDWQYLISGLTPARSLLAALKGHIGQAERIFEAGIAARERAGDRFVAAWTRLYLCELYLDIISATERPPLSMLLRNIASVCAVMFRGPAKITKLVEQVRRNPHFDPNGYFIGRAEMVLGLLCKTKKKRALAVQHLTEAKRITSQFGQSPMLARIEAALAELQ